MVDASLADAMLVRTGQHARARAGPAAWVDPGITPHLTRPWRRPFRAGGPPYKPFPIGSFTRKNALRAIPHRSLDRAAGHVWSGTMAARCPICNLAARHARDSPADPRSTHASLDGFRGVLGAGGCHVECCTSRSLRVESSRWKLRQLGPPGAGVQPCRLRAQACAWVVAVEFLVWFRFAV